MRAASPSAAADGNRDRARLLFLPSGSTPIGKVLRSWAQSGLATEKKLVIKIGFLILGYFQRSYVGFDSLEIRKLTKIQEDVNQFLYGIYNIHMEMKVYSISMHIKSGME